jgi:Domain of unknown function (DUF5655)
MSGVARRGGVDQCSQGQSRLRAGQGQGPSVNGPGAIRPYAPFAHGRALGARYWIVKAEQSGPETLFAGHPFALAVVERIQDIVASIGEATIRTTKSQVAFRRRRGFAYLWPPVIGNPGVEVVLSIALGRHDPSPRFKQVAHPAPRIWMHHMEIRDLAQLDDEVKTWLAEAFENAA